MLNKKIIIPNFFRRGWGNADYIEVNHYANYGHKLTDLIKVMCTLNGCNYDSITSLGDFANRFGGQLKTNHWYSWGLFEFKGYYKGTIHLKFQNERDWFLVNQAYGKLKGFVLPEKYNKKQFN